MSKLVGRRLLLAKGPGEFMHCNRYIRRISRSQKVEEELLVQRLGFVEDTKSHGTASVPGKVRSGGRDAPADIGVEGEDTGKRASRHTDEA
jgi:hypothetical protein